MLRRTLDPVWKERFEIRVYSDSSSILEISVYDYEEFGFSDNFIGRFLNSVALYIFASLLLFMLQFALPKIEKVSLDLMIRMWHLVLVQCLIRNLLLFIVI